MGVWFQSFHHSLMFLNVHNLTSEAGFQLLNQGELDVIGNLSLAERICWHVFIRSLRNNNANLKTNKPMRARPESARSRWGAFSVTGTSKPLFTAWVVLCRHHLPKLSNSGQDPNVGYPTPT